MKVVLAGAFGNLGADILKALAGAGHEVVAADMAVREIEGVSCETVSYTHLTLPTIRLV